MVGAQPQACSLHPATLLARLGRQQLLLVREQRLVELINSVLVHGSRK